MGTKSRETIYGASVCVSVTEKLSLPAVSKCADTS
jgi:hypothetical protein